MQHVSRAAISDFTKSRTLMLDNSPTLILPPLAMTWMHRRNLFAGPFGRRKEMAADMGLSFASSKSLCARRTYPLCPALVGSALLAFLPPASKCKPSLGETYRC